MSRVWEDRVWEAHPLPLAARAVLLAVARQVPDGQSEVLVNRTLLARDLETSADVVRRALTAGEAGGVVAVLKNGRIAFCAEPMLIAPPARPHLAAVAPAPPAPAAQEEKATTAWVLAEFGRQWEGQYRQRYVFTPGKDHKLAATLATLTRADLASRVRTYLRHDDPFYARCTHAFGIFATRVNDFISTRPAASAAVEDDDEYGRIERKTRERLRAERRG